MMTQERADVGMYWKRGVRRPNANSTNAATSMTCYPLQCILGTDNIKLTFQQQNIFLMTTRLHKLSMFPSVSLFLSSLRSFNGDTCPYTLLSFGD